MDWVQDQFFCHVGYEFRRSVDPDGVGRSRDALAQPRTGVRTCPLQPKTWKFHTETPAAF